MNTFTEIQELAGGVQRKTLGDREWVELTKQWRSGKVPYEITRCGDDYCATIKLPLKDGQILACRGHASVGECAEEIGYHLGELDEIGAWSDDDWAAIDSEWARDDQELGYAGEYDDDELLEGLFGKISSAFKGAGKMLKKMATGKALKAAIRVAAKVASNPGVMAALGVVTGGAALPALAAAKTAYDIYDAAKSGKRAAGSARKLAKAAIVVAERASGKRRKPRRRPRRSGWLRGTRLSNKQAQKLGKLRAAVRRARKRRKSQAPKRRARARKDRQTNTLPRAAGRKTFQYMVAISERAA